ncbi:MarR family transcriptional regulator [Streptomyces sp. NPDC001380]|uniref:MarR family transcriptional regulator n=1 Tax=Streptomyces sp. NPDC001380 TaxID=3364566 RepID=UPI00368797D2
MLDRITPRPAGTGGGRPDPGPGRAVEVTPAGVLGLIPRLGLTPSAVAVLGIMSDLQAPGGRVHRTQYEMARELGVPESAVSRGMKVLVDRHLVIRGGDGRGNSYRLHPFVAKYASQEEMESALRAAAGEVRAGRLPDISAPPHRRRQARPGGTDLVAV